MRARQRAALVILAAAPLALGPTAAWAHSGPGLVQASAGDPTASCAVGAESGTNAPNTEVEPYVAVNPWNPHQAIGVFQQDRWTNGGAHAGGVVWTRDGVHFSEGLLPFGTCGAPGGTSYERISDLWVSFGPDGVAYASGLEFDVAGARNGVGAATSFDGGRTWKFAQPIIADNDPAVGDDKNSVTADPRRPGTAYQVWDRLDQPFDANGNALSFDSPGYFSVTHDYGRTWSTPRVIVNTSVTPNTQTIGNIIVVDNRTGRLYNVFDQITYTDPNTTGVVDAHYGVVSSSDGGRTWSAPTRIAPDTSIGDVDPNAPDDPTKALRTGSGLPNVAIDPVTGELYVAFEGTTFTGGATSQVELVHSTDHGRTWSAPVRISHGPQAPSYTPSIAVDPTGTVSVTYYDVRDLKPGNTTTLPTSTWLYSFPRGHQQDAVERRIAPDFDWLLAPDAGGHFLGDYEGLAASGFDAVRPFFSATLNAPQTNVFSGAFETPWGDPFGLGQLNPGTATPHAAAPANSAARIAAHIAERKTAH
jgi:hypothetical protein